MAEAHRDIGHNAADATRGSRAGFVDNDKFTYASIYSAHTAEVIAGVNLQAECQRLGRQHSLNDPAMHGASAPPY
jgi:hypothetical protein